MMRWTCLVLLALGLGARPGSADEMEAHIDPQTGRLVPEPATPRPLRALPAPPPPVAETPAPGGGMMAVLNGQFTSDLVATVRPDGSVRVDCVARTPRVPDRP